MQEKEIREQKILMSQAGTGTGARINLSMPFLREVMGVDYENRDIVVVYDNKEKEIIIKQKYDYEAIRKRGLDIISSSIEEDLKEIENDLDRIKRQLPDLVLGTISADNIEFHIRSIERYIGTIRKFNDLNRDKGEEGTNE